MTLEGVLDNSLGNFICLRGFAPLGDLNQISEPDESYQRDLIQKHRQEMINFLDDQRFLFFPEVVLGASLGEGSDIEAISEFVLGFESDKGSRHKFKNFNLRYSVNMRQGRNDLRESVRFRRATLDIPDAKLAENGFPKFHRIDGNHRLSVLSNNDSLEEGLRQKFSSYNVPFCLVLFRTSDELKQYSRALFHNINFRQIALTMEQSLKLMLEDDDLFKDDVLKTSFGDEYLLARQILRSWDLSMIPNVAGVVEPTEGYPTLKRTFLLSTFKLLLQHGLVEPNEAGIKKFKKHLGEINAVYEEEKLQQNRNEGLLTAFVFYAFQPKPKLQVFKNWVIKNHIYETESTNSLELIKIFNCVLEARKRTIFVSMQFSEQTKQNHTAIKSAVNDVNSEYKLDLKLREIRIDEYLTGYSYKIDDEILDLVRSCGLLIADLSLGNKNVYTNSTF